MYFDPKPKSRKEDLYGREDELRRFSEALTFSPVIVVAGPRRTGKTSFINVALREAKVPHIFLDLRELPYNPSRAELVRRLEDGINKIDRKWLHSLFDQLKHLRGIEIMGNSISLSWSNDGVRLPEIFDQINRWAERNNTRFVAAFDEIQAVRGDKDLVRYFAHVADFDRNIVLVFTGSEVGLLFSFLGFDDPESPLFGRHRTEIKMGSLNLEQSSDFLASGFRQLKMDYDEETIRYAIDRMDGIIGWLTLYGARCKDAGICNRELVDEVVGEGGRLARAEAVQLTNLTLRYGTILNLLAAVPGSSWADVKRAIGTREGSTPTNHVVTLLLDRLRKLGFVIKSNGGYMIADPVLRAGILSEKLPD